MKKVEIIGMPMKYGCFVDGADKSYEYLKDTFDKVFASSSKVIDTTIENIEEHKNDKKLKYVEPVMEISKRLYQMYLLNIHMIYLHHLRNIHIS